MLSRRLFCFILVAWLITSLRVPYSFINNAAIFGPIPGAVYKRDRGNVRHLLPERHIAENMARFLPPGILSDESPASASTSPNLSAGTPHLAITSS